MDRNGRLAEIAGLAVAAEKSTGVPAVSTVSQWAVESKWGEKPVGQHNCFGIKHASRHTGSCIVTTHEYFTERQIESWNSRHYLGKPARLTGGKSPDGRLEVLLDDVFADYASLEESVADYVWLIGNGAPYRDAWKTYQETKDVAGLVLGVAKSYSTSSSYADLVLQISGQSNVKAAIEAARAA